MQRSEHVEAAERAGLRYTPDSMRGIRRDRVAGAFVYIGSNGQPLTNEQKLRRIRSLAIPPAWTDVWICPDANGHLQVTARDARGRKQYRYHPKYRAIRDETKFDRMIEFSRVLPAARVAVVAAGAIFVGAWAGDIVPINKQLWSPTFVLVTAGIAALLLVLLIPVDHVRLLAFAAKPLMVIGANALLVFVLAELVQVGLRRMITVDGACGPAPCRLVDAHTWLFEQVFEPLAGERLGSLAFSGAILVTMWIIAAVLWRACLFVRA